VPQFIQADTILPSSSFPRRLPSGRDAYSSCVQYRQSSILDLSRDQQRALCHVAGFSRGISNARVSGIVINRDSVVGSISPEGYPFVVSIVISLMSNVPNCLSVLSHEVDWSPNNLVALDIEVIVRI